MKHLPLFLVVLLTACSTGPTIEPEPERRELGQQGAVAVTVPLLWHASEHWQIDPLFGAAERGRCGVPESDLFPLALELDPATLPSGSTVFGATLTIDPCDDRVPWLPDTLPVFGLFAVDRWGHGVQATGGAQDSSPDVAAYIEPHEIVMQAFPAPVVVNREKHRYMMLFEPEYGLDATGGTRVTGLALDVISP
jgi:hypothetical protein